MELIRYDREAAVLYAKRWAFGRNPDYYNFDLIGGDCTNFASQCLFAGCGMMNFTPVTGWFYRSADDRTASWTGVEYLFNFLTGNNGEGPFAVRTDLDKLQPGDIVQLATATDDFYHSPVVVAVKGRKIFVAAHSYDAYMRPLNSYNFAKVRGIHIEGVRK